MASEKQQFNVYLDARLVAAIKRASLDRQQTLSDFVAEALTDYLQPAPAAGRQAGHGVQTSKVAASTAISAGAGPGGVPGANAAAAPKGITPLPVVFVKDMRATLGFFKVLGFRLRARSRNGRWAELEAEDGTGLALHADDGEGRSLELSFESHGPLEPVLERLGAAGFQTGEIVDEGFGRSTFVDGPGGFRARLDEHDPSLFL